MKKSVLTAGVALCAWVVGCSSGSGPAISKTFGMGERVQVGQLIYTVIDTEWLEQLGQNENARLPKKGFLAIRLSVTNSGSSTSGIPSLNLIDAKGESHAELSDAEGLPQWLGPFRTVKPSETEHGRILFDVAPAAYRLRVTNDADADSEKAALVTIPLQFAPEPPKTDVSSNPAR